MDELKHRAGEKLEALHVAAKTVADNGKSRVNDAVQTTVEAVRKIREAFHDIWHNELIAEGRERAAAWTREAVKRIREGAPPLSPVLLYEELVALWHDRVWRRSMLIFTCGVVVGGSAGVLVGLRLARRVHSGPHARALHSQSDHSVILVEDAVAPSAGTGEVLVRVQAFSICTVDRGALRGRAHLLRSLLYRGHVTVGRGFAGVVLDVGQGVTDLEMGDEVWGCVTEWSGGAATELLTIRSTRVSKRPRGLAADTAASLPWAGGEALIALRNLSYTPENCKGKRVAVCGAASGEGCALVQLLSTWGVHVTVVAPRHAALTLKDLGAADFVDIEGNRECGAWLSLESRARRSGPWDAVLACAAPEVPPPALANKAALLKATASRKALLDLRPGTMITDRLPTPFAVIFATTFYSYRVFRWLLGCGSNTDWLEDRFRLRPGLDTLTKLVERGALAPILDKWLLGCGSNTDWLEDRFRLRPGLDTLTKLVERGALAPILDKVYLPQDFESALAHACSDDAIGTTVIRFP